MATVTVEIVTVGPTPVAELSQVIDFLNHRQDAFRYAVISDSAVADFAGNAAESFTTDELYGLLYALKQRRRGYHPFLVALVDRRLDGKVYGNLFGSLRQEVDSPHAMAIATLYQIPVLLPNIPPALYIAFELLSFSIRFLYGEGLIHDERRGCVFDRKVNKLEIFDAMRNGRLCPSCEGIVSKALDVDQGIAAERLFEVISEVCRSDNPSRLWDKHIVALLPKVFLCHSSSDRTAVHRIAKSLVDKGCRVWLDAWEIRIGDNIVAKINDGLASSDLLAVALSREAINSEWVMNEWTAKFIMAAGTQNVTVLPLLLEDCTIPPLLRPLRYADFRSPNEYDDTVTNLFEAIRHLHFKIKATPPTEHSRDTAKGGIA